MEPAIQGIRLEIGIDIIYLSTSIEVTSLGWGFCRKFLDEQL